MDSAKVFMTGRSQAVRLPKAYRFDTDEVQIERRADGAVVLRPLARRPLGERLRTILQDLPPDPAFSRLEQPGLERDAAWWAKQGFADGAGARAKRKRRAGR